MRYNLVASAALILWLPAVLFYFAGRPPRRAVIVSFIVAWLFLPNIGYNLPGIPDYTKMTATTIGVLLGVAIFDPGRFFALWFRPVDLPMAAWCTCPFFSSLANNLGPYEGLSAMLAHLLPLGLPYLIGRMYLGDHQGVRELARGLVVGGLAYVPLCLIEVRMSQVFDPWVYGIPVWEGMRYGGYRPKVFLSNGLELGTWMANATLVCFGLWLSGSIRRIQGYSTGVLTLVLLVTTILCKSTGAGVLMLVGMGALGLIKLTRSAWPAWFLLLIPPAYEVSRPTGLWSGREAVAVARSTFGEARAQSLQFRFENEDLLFVRVKQRPWLGYGRSGGFLEADVQGKPIQIVDGYWIIALGIFGVVGMAAFTASWLSPLFLLIRRQPASTWARPEAGASAVLSLMLGLFMIDNLSNAMHNPIFALAMGGLVGLPSGRKAGALVRAESALAAGSELLAGGRAAEAEPEFRRAAGLVAGRPGLEERLVLAEALDGLGHSLSEDGRIDSAGQAFRDALEVRESIADDDPGLGPAVDLARAREGLARALAESGQVAEAIQQRRTALRVWDALTAHPPVDPDLLRHRVDALNDLAWLLATDPVPALRDPAEALALAEEAVRIAPDHAACWNTLGVARYRAGDLRGAIEALERSAASSPGGGTAFDLYPLAMACRRLGEGDRARHYFDRAVAWADRHRPGHPTLARFRAEAAGLL